MQLNSIQDLAKCLSPAKAATAIGVSQRRVHQYCKEGRFGDGRAIKIGGVWYIDPDAVKEVAAQERVPGNPNFGKTA